ncbi:unnamed protein product [Rotaria sordida]|uniref:Uncharacterized protein n=1 Tax=Rotaria sordida TaxID=392033 RepID=A0A814P810_9BILA|nr:unnamed protein product [Rotaria sordida]CAF3551262.1 unnamed protein product [Rotaria sordida]
MGNKETLSGFQFRVLHPPLRDCLADENKGNTEIVLITCRALTYLMELLPCSAAEGVEITPIFLRKIIPSIFLEVILLFVIIHIENLVNRLRSDNKKTVEHIASTQLIKPMKIVLVVQRSLLNNITFLKQLCLLTSSTEEKSTTTTTIPIIYKSAALSTNETIPMNI